MSPNLNLVGHEIYLFISSALDACSGRTIVMGDFNDLEKNELLEYFSDSWAGGVLLTAH